MRLFYEKLNLDIKMSDSGLYGLCIEDHKILCDFVNSMYIQSTGDEGDIYITNGSKNIRFDKMVTVIFNPFSLNVNEKKILAKLYTEMETIAKEELYLELQTINTDIVHLLDEINMKMQYPLEYELELDIQHILKGYSVHIDEQETELPDRIANYIKLAHQILGIQLFVFVHLKDYLSIQEIELLQEMIRYENIQVLLLETSTVSIFDMKWWIVDKDACIIEI